MFGVKSLFWLLSAVNEVKTTRREQNGDEKKKERRKEVLGRDAGHAVLQLYLIKAQQH